MSPAHEILYGGAAGGGKSYLLRLACSIYSMWVPGLISFIFRRTFKELMQNHIWTPGGFLQMLKPQLDAKLVIWDRSNYMFRWENGSIIQLAHAQWESDVFSYQGAQFGFLAIDESTHFTEKMIRFLRHRVRLPDKSGIPEEYRHMFPRILYCSNPGGVGHDYFKRNFVDHGEHVWRAPSSDGGMLRQFIQAKVDDNLTLQRNDPDYKDRIRGLGEDVLVDAMLEGDWNIVAEGMFSDLFRPKIHVVKEFNIPKSWRIDRGHDWGSSAPGGNLYFAESDGSTFHDADGNECWVPRGSVFVCGEVYFATERREGARMTAAQQAQRMVFYERQKFSHRVVYPGPADNSIWTKDRDSTSIHDVFVEYGIRFTKADKTPGSRIVRWQLIRERLQAAVTYDRERPHLYIMDNCTHLIRTLPALQRDERKQEDIDTHGEDHLADILGYKMLQLSKSVGVTRVIGL